MPVDLKNLEESIKRESPTTGLLLNDTKVLADQSKPLPLRHSGNSFRNFFTAIRPQMGATSHAIGNKLTSASHAKRKIVSSGMGMVASTTTGYVVGWATGLAATSAFVATAALTGGIAAGVLVLGLLIGIAVSQYQKAQKEQRKKNLALGTRTNVQMLDDLRYLLTHGELEEIARYHEKALKTEKELFVSLMNTPSTGVSNCGEAATIAYKMYRHKKRLEEKLVADDRKKHVCLYNKLVQDKIKESSALLQSLGKEFVESVVKHRLADGTLGRTASKKPTLGIVKGEFRDYLELKLKTWVNDALKGSGDKKAAAFLDVLTLLYEAKMSSTGDHNDVAGKVSNALDAASLSTSSLGSTGQTGNKVAAMSAQTLLDGMLLTGKTAATEAAKISAFGSMASGAPGSIAASGGAGFAAGLLVSSLVGAVLEYKNDKNNMAALKTEKDPVQRIWILRSLLEAGRINILYESYRKTQESTERLNALVTAFKAMNVRPSYALMVEAATHLYRIQKHVIRMIAVGGLLNMFFNELDKEVGRMVRVWSDQGGLAPRAIHIVKGQVVKDHACNGTCYGLVMIENGVVKVQHRLSV